MATISPPKESLSLSGNISVIEIPWIEPVAVSDVEKQIRFSLVGQELHIKQLITAVREKCEAVTRRSLVVKQEVIVLNSFPCNRGYIELSKPPLRSVESIVYLDTSNVEQTLDPTLYKVVFNTRNPVQPSYVIPVLGQSWPVSLNELDSVTVNYTCGYGSIVNAQTGLRELIEVPKAIKQWMLINIANLYENPETIQVNSRVQMVEIPTLADSLIANYRIARW